MRDCLAQRLNHAVGSPTECGLLSRANDVDDAHVRWVDQHDLILNHRVFQRPSLRGLRQCRDRQVVELNRRWHLGAYRYVETMAGRGDSHITNRSDDRRSLCRIELNLCGTRGLRLTSGPHLRGTRANTASEREHDCSVQKTAVHGVLLLVVRAGKNFLNGAGVPDRTAGSRGILWHPSTD